ncbi:hypothetical protein HAX54_002668, partial [Datura stramonium]|nr:hypothetical protein [Datura stramonium]
AVNQLGDADEVIIECAVVVMDRMSNKLTGHDFAATSASSSSLHSMRWITVHWFLERRVKLIMAANQLGDADKVLNECVVAVMARMSNKLTGHDFAATSASSSSLHSKCWIIAANQLGDVDEVLNECVVAVMARMSNKLTGHDLYSTSASLSSLHRKHWIA